MRKSAALGKTSICRDKNFFLIRFDGSLHTVDDFRASGNVIASGEHDEKLEIKTNDRFALFDWTSGSIVAHGKISSDIFEVTLEDFCTNVRLSCGIGRKKNFPLKISGLDRSLNAEVLANMKKKALCQITESEFNEIFQVWWGIRNFSLDS